MSNGPKETFEALQYGNRFGHLSYGSLNLAGTGGLEADVLTGVSHQAYNALHYIHMENDGIRKGWTMMRNPGAWEVKCGDSLKKGDIGAMIWVENGDIVLTAPNGRIRLEAVDIDLKATGYNETNGYVNIEGNQGINIKTPGSLEVQAEKGMVFFSPQAIDIVSNTVVNFVSNFVGGFTSASNIHGGKGFSQSKQLYQTKNKYT